MSVDVVITTWPNHPKRLEYFRDCLRLLRERLTASRHEMHWHCTSESMQCADAEWCGADLQAICDDDGIALSWRTWEPGLGENMNAALRLGESPMILLVQDDCHITEPLDLSPGIDFMDATADVDLLRYMWPPDERVGLIENGDGWRRFDVNDGWCYSDRPHLRRRSFMDKWGWYLEKQTWQGASEGDMLLRLRAGNAVIAAADKRYFESPPMPRVSCDTTNKRWPSNR